MAIPAMNFIQPQHEREADLICEALVKEIGRSNRWCAKVDAWNALLRVRMIADSMSAEQRHLHPDASAAGQETGTPDAGGRHEG